MGEPLSLPSLVGLQVVPLQMTLVYNPYYAQVGLNGTFLGVWLFHTGFGLPYAIYLMTNFLGTLPNDLFESAYLDSTNHWTVFHRLVIPSGHACYCVAGHLPVPVGLERSSGGAGIPWAARRQS